MGSESRSEYPINPYYSIDLRLQIEPRVFSGVTLDRVRSRTYISVCSNKEVAPSKNFWIDPE
jgi:hypothetical protein